MKAETLKALKESIAHWRRMATGKARKDEKIGPDDCALCELFLWFRNQCAGCPVAEAGYSGCAKSPYEAADKAEEIYGMKSPQFKKAAKRELAFLESLLPKPKRKTKKS